MSSTGGLCIFACIFLSIIGEVEGVVSYPPSNTVAEVNGEAIFNCSAVPSGPLAWVLTRDGIPGAGEIRITFGCIVNAGFQNHYKTEQPGGPTTCNLIVLNITMEQAGVYHCTDTDTYRAQLTVLDSSPGITYNNTPDVIEKENVVFTCTLNFNGSVEPAPSLRPHFYWTDYTGRNVSSFNDSWPGNDSAVSQLSVTAGRQDIMPYTCHVYLKLIPTTTPMYASNTPTVTSSASSPPIGVLYSPGNISIASSVSPQDECVQQQESLTCTADAKPQAQYEWLDLNSNTMSNGSVKYIISGGQYQCTAYNYLRTKIHNDTKTTTEAKCYPVTENNMTITGCTKDSCYCTGNQPLALTCQVYSVPKATYQWWKDDQKYSANQTIPVTHNGNYSCTARNSIGTNSSEATVSTSVFNCNWSALLWLIIIVPLWIIACWIACFLFFRKHCNVSKRKVTYFPVLMKMLSCLNKNSSAKAPSKPEPPTAPSTPEPPTAPSTPEPPTNPDPSKEPGGNVGWIILYIVIVTFFGIFAIPIMFLIVQCSKPKKKVDPKNTDSEQSKETRDTESSEVFADKSV